MKVGETVLRDNKNAIRMLLTLFSICHRLCSPLNFNIIFEIVWRFCIFSGHATVFCCGIMIESTILFSANHSSNDWLYRISSALKSKCSVHCSSKISYLIQIHWTRVLSTFHLGFWTTIAKKICLQHEPVNKFCDYNQLHRYLLTYVEII